MEKIKTRSKRKSRPSTEPVHQWIVRYCAATRSLKRDRTHITEETSTAPKGTDSLIDVRTRSRVAELGALHFPVVGRHS